MIVAAMPGKKGEIFEKRSCEGVEFILPLDRSKIMIACCAGPLLEEVKPYDQVEWYAGNEGRGFGWRLKSWYIKDGEAK